MWTSFKQWKMRVLQGPRARTVTHFLFRYREVISKEISEEVAENTELSRIYMQVFCLVKSGDLFFFQHPSNVRYLLYSD